MPKTIILHGTGRSGTSMLNNILVNHPDLAWISNYQVYALNFPILSLANRFVNHSVDLNRKDRNKFMVHSSNEPYAMWKKFYPNFNKEGGTPSGEPFQLERYTQKITKYAGKKAFVTKITGESRANFLEHAFSDYVVVWIDRDPIAVVSSMMKQRWFFKNTPEAFELLSFEEKMDRYIQLYQGSLDLKKKIPKNRLLEVAYEDLVKNPKEFFERLLEKLNLEKNNDFFSTLEDWNIRTVGQDTVFARFSEGELAYLDERLKAIRS